MWLIPSKYINILVALACRKVRFFKEKTKILVLMKNLKVKQPFIFILKMLSDDWILVRRLSSLNQDFIEQYCLICS